MAASESDPEPIWHEEILDYLRGSDTVLPKAPNVHPRTALYNKEGIVPPQCYTKTEGVFNPCYVCHQDGLEGRENVMNDRDLQIDYSFSDLGQKNHWKNLFEDRSDRVAQISDKAISEYIWQDNYSDLAERLRDAGFEGWIPDMKGLHLAADAFDEEGFAKDGSNWIAFNYKPFPSTFWPTNGSTDDVMIRLPESFRSKEDGTYSKDVYKANLAILEALMKGYEKIDCLPLNEEEVGLDLNQDGVLGTITEITKVDRFVAGAKKAYIEPHIFPEGTEFMHSVRYVGVSNEGDIVVPTTNERTPLHEKMEKVFAPRIRAAIRTRIIRKRSGKSAWLPVHRRLGSRQRQWLVHPRIYRG